MRINCLACGSAKDTSVKEPYPYPDDGILDDRPIAPLFAIECRGSGWRVVIVCHHCIHKLDPDMWISDRCWAALNPVTPFERLPIPIDDEDNPGGRFNVEAYATSVG